MPFIGIPPFGQTVRTVTTITATASQTSFTPTGGYTVGYCDVYYNGIKLVGGTDFTATDGLTVVLTAGATSGAVVEIITYGTVTITDAVRRSGDTFSGAVAINSTLAAGNTTITGNTTTTTLNSGNTAITGTLAAGNTTITGTANVSGAATFSNTVSIAGNVVSNVTFSANTTHVGAAAFSNTITVTGNATFSNTIAIGSDYISPYTGFKNRIINGDMRIDQRNAGASVTPANATYTLDRWKCYQTTASKFSVQQTPSATETGYATRVSAGFTNYLAITSLSSYSVLSSDYYTLQQPIEGFNTADLAWGTANAKTVTLSFLAYSSLTGTFGGSIFNQAGNRSYPFSYTISSANTWTSISVTIAGDTSGTWAGATNGISLQICFGLGAGSTYTGTSGVWAGALYSQPTGTVSVVGTNGATFYITGVQLEKGSTATAFDYRPVGSELQLCQRYYEKSYNQEYVPGTFNVGWDGTSTNGTSFAEGPGPRFKVSKRTNPTVVIYNAVSGATARMYQVSTAASIAVALRNIGHNGVGIVDYTSSGGQNSYYFQWTADAEL